MLFLSRIIIEKSNRKLDPDKKALLFTVFLNKNYFHYIILIVVILAFVLNLKFKWLGLTLSFIIYFSTLFIYIAVISYSSYIKLKRNDFPPDYIKNHIIASVMKMVAFISFLAIALE